MTIEEYEEELRLHLESLDPSNTSILLTPKKDSGDMQTRLFLTPRPVEGLHKCPKHRKRRQWIKSRGVEYQRYQHW